MIHNDHTYYSIKDECSKLCHLNPSVRIVQLCYTNTNTLCPQQAMCWMDPQLIKDAVNNGVVSNYMKGEEVVWLTVRRRRAGRFHYQVRSSIMEAEFCVIDCINADDTLLIPWRTKCDIVAHQGQSWMDRNHYFAFLYLLISEQFTPQDCT